MVSGGGQGEEDDVVELDEPGAMNEEPARVGRT
jgi:hypothetical protein